MQELSSSLHYFKTLVKKCNLGEDLRTYPRLERHLTGSDLGEPEERFHLLQPRCLAFANCSRKLIALMSAL